MSSPKRHQIRVSRKSALLGSLAGWLIRALTATLRLRIEDRCGLGHESDRTPPVIYLLWHNRIAITPPAWCRLVRGKRRCVVLTSASRDGHMLASAMAVFGLGAVRGSSSRRGVAALIALKQAIAQGSDVCITPDGPKGPRYMLQPGALKLAQSTGARIVPIHLRFDSAWRLASWDRFVIPKPFSRVEVCFDEALAFDREMDEAAFEQARQKLEVLLVAGVDDA